MRKFCCLLLFIAIQTAFGHWERLPEWTINENLTDVWVSDSIIMTPALKSEVGTEKKYRISTDYGKTFPKTIEFPLNQVEAFYFQGEKMVLGGANQIWLTTDLGENWTRKEDGLPESYFLISLAISANKMFACTSEGLFIYDNAGSTWTLKSDGALTEAYPKKVIITKDKIYLLGLLEGKKLLLVSSDEGATWKKCPTDPVKAENLDKFFATDKEIYWSAANLYPIKYYIYKSTDYGVTWSETLCDSLPNSQNYSFYAVGNKFIYLAESTSLEFGYKISTDGGKTWNPGYNDLPIPLKAGIKKLLIDKGKIYAMSYSDLWSSSDTAKSWQPIIKKDNYNYINGIAASEDNFYVLTNASVQLSDKRDGVYVLDKSEGKWAGLGLENESIYGLYPEKNFLLTRSNTKRFISFDEGKSWKPFKENLSNPDQTTQIAIIDDAIIEKNGYEGVLVTTDYGATWEDRTEGLPKKNIYSLASGDKNLFVTTDSSLYLSTDLGKSWKNIGMNLPKGSVTSSSIIAKGNVIILYYGPGMYISRNLGESWNWIGDYIEIPDYYNRRLNDVSFLGSAISATIGRKLLISTDDGYHWEVKMDGIMEADVITFRGPCIADGEFAYIVGDIRTPANNLVIYKTKLSSLLSIAEDSDKQTYFNVSPNPAADIITLSGLTALPGEKIEIYTQLGVKVLEAAEAAEKIDVSALPAGIYFLKTEGKTGKFVKI